MVPFPLPEGVMVHHDWLLVAVQFVFAATANAAVPDDEVTVWFDGVTAREGLAWVTVTTTGVSVATITVILATLAEVPVFCVNDVYNVPFPVPEGVTVHQDWLLEAVHAAFDVTVKGIFPEGGVTDWLDGVTASVGTQAMKQNVISFAVVFSVMLVSGKLVLAPAQEWEFGVVASENDALLPVPGNGQPPPLIVPYTVGGFPVAVAQTGYKPW